MKRYLGWGLGGSWAELVFIILLVWEVVHPPGSSSNPMLLEFLMEASWCRHDQLLTPFPVTLSSPETRTENSNHGVVFLVAHSYPEATQEPTQSYLIRTKDCYHLGNSKGFRRPASGMGGFKDQILEQKMLLVLLSLRKLQGFPLCQEPGADISVHLFVISHYYTLWVNSEHRHHQMLARMWSNRNPHSMLLEMQNGTATQKTIWWFPFLN